MWKLGLAFGLGLLAAQVRAEVATYPVVVQCGFTRPHHQGQLELERDTRSWPRVGIV